MDMDMDIMEIVDMMEEAIEKASGEKHFHAN